MNLKGWIIIKVVIKWKKVFLKNNVLVKTMLYYKKLEEMITYNYQ